jgi:hypothetical protein
MSRQKISRKLSSNSDDLLLEKVRDTAARAAAELDRCVVRVAANLNADGVAYDIKLASHLSYLGTGVVHILGELRKLDAGLRAQARKMTPEQEHEAMLEYLRTLPIERRADVRAVLDELDTDVSVLGHDTAAIGEDDELQSS